MELFLEVYLFIYVYVCVPSVQGDQKRVSGPLKLELQTIVSRDLGKHQSSVEAPSILFFFNHLVSSLASDRIFH